MEESPPKPISTDNNHQYYLQYKKVHEQAIQLSRCMKNMNKRQQQLLDRIAELSGKAEEFRDIIRPESSEFRRKKNRRTADEIHKEYKCPQERCDHKYGTEASLRIHIKKKHSDLYEPKKRGKSRNDSSNSQSSPSSG